MSESGWRDATGDDEDDDYFSETLEDAELTGNEPRFVKIKQMDQHHSELGELKIDDLIRQYIDVRNQLATDRKGYKAREAKVKTHLQILSMLLRDKGDMMGVDNFKTASGTAYRNKKESFRVSDWESLVAYIKETGNFQVIQKRVSPNAVKEIREQEIAAISPAALLAMKQENITPDWVMPGVEPRIEIEFAVRSPSARGKK